MWKDVSAATLQTKKTYTDLGWDFSKVWTWSESLKQPILKGFDPSIFKAVDYSIDGTRIISRATNLAKQNATTNITAQVVTADTVQSAKLYYGYDSANLTNSVTMNRSGSTYSAAIPTTKSGTIYYYIEVKTDKETVTKPYYSDEPIALYVDDGTIQGDPYQITIVPDSKQGGLRFSWLTDPAVKKTVIEYKVAGSSTWKSASGTTSVSAVTPGYKEKASHNVVISGLTPSANYV